jgi:hypothetical protein
MKSLDLLEENKPSNDLIIDEEGKVTLPEGYLWCMDCAAATPHIEKSGSHWECKICGIWKYDGEMCTNCGWSMPEEELKSQQMYVIRHSEDCPEFKKIQDWEKKNDEFGFLDDRVKPLIRKIRVPVEEIEYVVGERKCDCPFDTIYPCLNIFNYRSWRPYSMDCMNAVEWSYDVRCLICGEVFNIQDGNC